MRPHRKREYGGKCDQSQNLKQSFLILAPYHFQSRHFFIQQIPLHRPLIPPQFSIYLHFIVSFPSIVDSLALLYMLPVVPVTASFPPSSHPLGVSLFHVVLPLYICPLPYPLVPAKGMISLLFLPFLLVDSFYVFPLSWNIWRRSLARMHLAS